MAEWKFVVASCGHCDASLAKRKVAEADVKLVTTRVAAEPDTPDVYAAPCPQCQRYNPVTEKGATVAEPSESEPEEPTEPEA